METEIKNEYNFSFELKNLLYNSKIKKLNTLEIEITNQVDFYAVVKFEELITKFVKPKLYNIIFDFDYIKERGKFQIEYKKDLDLDTLFDIFEEIYKMTYGYHVSTKKNFWGKEKVIKRPWSKFDWSITENALKYKVMQILGVERINKNYLHTLLDNIEIKEKYF